MIRSARAGKPALQGPVYLDASAWVKLYQTEAHSDALNQLLLGRSDLFASDLGATEVTSALGRACRESRLDRVSARHLHRKLRQDMTAGIVQRLDLTPAIHERAERMLLADAETPLRAADALHVALASETGMASVVTYDPRMATAARSAGLTIYSPGAALG